MDHTKNLKFNMLMNGIKGLMGIIFPFITFPYISKVLGVEVYGKYNFAVSIINYFIQIAGLGIAIYAIREGAKIRSDRRKLESFASEVFSINVISTICSYLILALLLIAAPKFEAYKSLIIILSLQIVFRTIGVEWIYSIYEDYMYITVRSIAFQVLSIIAMFCFVKTENDYNIYAGITVLASVGSNVLNWVHAKKYCKISVNHEIRKWKQHLKPIFTLFATSVTTTIYTSSDVTILGLLSGDHAVGIYAVASKIYGIIKVMLSSVITVSIPHLTAQISSKIKDALKHEAEEVYKILITLLLPVVVGIIMMRKEIVLIIADESYIQGTAVLMILSIALICCLGAWFWGQCILVPHNQESFVFKTTVVSALVNVVLNFALIPLWGASAAALTTCLAELYAFLMCRQKAQQFVKLERIGSVIIKTLCGCLVILVISEVLRLLQLNMFIYAIMNIVSCVIAYFAVEILLKNEAVHGVWAKFIKKRR